MSSTKMLCAETSDWLPDAKIALLKQERRHSRRHVRLSMSEEFPPRKQGSSFSFRNNLILFWYLIWKYK